MNKKKALLVSGYHALSQKHWAEYVERVCTHYEWTVIALPPRYFSWRMRGAPLSANALSPTAFELKYDLVMTTSSVDLATLQSIYPTLRNTPSIQYFHENQFAYPKNHQPQSVVDWQMVSLYAALRADKVLFNSEYNRESFFNGTTRLLKKLPDLVPPGITKTIRAKSDILHVPIKHQDSSLPKTPITSMRILWNHRWEWDKSPELLYEIIRQLEASSINFKIVLTGQQFRKIPEAMNTINSEFKHRIEHTGFVESRSEYEALLASCNVVLSTAVHEFQGIAVLEAVSAGCTPLLPCRLSYPEFFSDQFLYSGNSELESQAKSAVARLLNWSEVGLPSPPPVNHVSEESLLTSYRQKIAF